MIFLFKNINKDNTIVDIIVFKYSYFKFGKFFRIISILFLLVLFYFAYKYEYIKNEKLYIILKSLPLDQQKLINNYFLNISSIYDKEKFQEINDLISLFSMVNYSELSNDTIKTKLKSQLLNNLQKIPKSSIDDLGEDKIAYVDKSYNFGNSMVLLNNLFYYCEILNIKTIYLNINRKWPMLRNFTFNNISISFISPLNIDLNQNNIFIFDKKLIYFQNIFRPEIRINILKDEIKDNLPKINISEKDLYIHVRSGDIFQYIDKKNINYAQPPLCFYESVITNFKFRKINILAIDDSNPIINKLINHFPEIIFTRNTLELDLSILSNAYNIVGSISSFLTTLLIINENIKNFWEYDNYRLSQKYFHLHHDIYKYPINYTIYSMKPSIKYFNEMFPWRSGKRQLNLMLTEKCSNFDIKYSVNN